LIVSGCMSQRFARDLREGLPEVDAFIGLNQVSELGMIVEQIVTRPSRLRDASRASGTHALHFANNRPTYIPDYDTPRFRLTPAHYAYVKIAGAVIIHAVFA